MKKQAYYFLKSSPIIGGRFREAERRSGGGLRGALALGCATVGLALLAGCHTDMWVQNKVHKPYQESDFFPDGQSARPVVDHTVARGEVRADDALYTGKVERKLVDKFPFPITKEVLERGQERFNIYCSPCHGRLGDGNGMIAQRGFALRRQPGNYHTDRLRRMPIGHFYDVITNGFGVMYNYASRIEPKDRWAIVAYIRVLQRSQHPQPGDIPTEEMQKLGAPPSTPDASSAPVTPAPAGEAPGGGAAGENGNAIGGAPRQ